MRRKKGPAWQQAGVKRIGKVRNVFPSSENMDSFHFLCFSFFLINTGQIIETTASTRKNTEIGLMKKMLKLPFDIIRERLKLLSNMGPRIRARTTGAIGISI